jgi:calcium-dependent protein kinase
VAQVASFLEELRINGSATSSQVFNSARSAPESSSVGAFANGEDGADEVPEQVPALPPPPPPPPLFAATSPASEEGQRLLVQFAQNAVEAADEMSDDSQTSRREKARLYHSAAVYLDVVKAFSGLPSDLEKTLEYCRFRTYQSSHLLQNIVHEHMESDVHLEDHYIVHDKHELGRGTYGRVLRVTHRGTGRDYACKCINITRLEPRQVSKLYSEISIMREMDHPHIVRLREVFYTKRQLYAVMDLCTGGELFNLVTENPGDCASEAQIAQTVRRMLGAISYMHQHGIVHRDLKLENWLLESPDDLNSIKLIDFGLSKHFVQEEHMHQAVGSTYYVSPEVLLGCYTSKCDLWSMGVITYMMLSGAPPFWGSTDQQVRNRIVRGTFDMPDSLFKNVSSEAQDFITKLLEVNPDKRYDADQAAHHPWIQHSVNRVHPKGQLMKKNDLSQALRKYSQFSKFRRAILNVVARHMAPAELVSLRETFHGIDQDNSGTLSMQELANALQGHLSKDELSELWASLNVEEFHELDYNEFIAATLWTRLQLDEERLHEAFEAFDHDGKGFLTAQDIQKIVGMDMPEEEVRAMMADTDIDGDGRIDYMDFARVWKNQALARDYKPMSSSLFHRVKKTFSHVRLAVAFTKSSGGSSSSNSLHQNEHSPR